jgi:hypothetical protein
MSPVRASYYQKELNEIFVNGLTTIYGNYFSGEFFKKFCNVEPKILYFLKVHLLSINRFDYSNHDFVNSNNIRIYLARVAFNISLVIYQQKLFDNTTKPISVGKYFHSHKIPTITLDRSIFHLSNRADLEILLIYLRDNFLDTDNMLATLAEFVSYEKLSEKTALNVLRIVASNCKNLGVPKSLILDNINQLFRE